MARIAVASALTAGLMGIALSGCGMESEWMAPSGYPPPVQAPAAVYANPTFVPAGDPTCFWETLVDVVDDYFPIEHEEPVRMIGNGLSEGSITTVAQVSPTIFEPWRRDTGDRDQRDENTVQTMRRYAKVRVTPPLQGGGGFWVEIAVFKDLEDNAHPQHATAGAATLRYDSTLTGVVNPVVGDSITLGWINKGRDTALEQIMIGHLLSRCGQVGVPAMAQAPRQAR
jgi:hypothetical protein